MLDDFDKCCAVVNEFRDKYIDDVTGSLITALIVAEDHRNAMHHGVDPIAILRSFKARVFCGKRQGASTIEQQLVRTITGRYEKTPRRKIREQILAVMLGFKFGKKDLASCYLKVAYFGSSLVGGLGICKLRVESPDCSDAIIVAHLKYPRSSTGCGVAAIKHQARVEHVKRLLAIEDVGVFLYKPLNIFTRFFL